MALNSRSRSARSLFSLALLAAALLPADAARADTEATLSLPGRHSLAEPDIAVDPANSARIVVGAQAQDEGTQSHPILSFASGDGGRSFARRNLIGVGLNDVYHCGFDPVVTFGTAGQLYFANLFGGPLRHKRGYPGGAAVDRSSDGGFTFTRSVLASEAHTGVPRLASCYPVLLPLPFDDKPWISVQRSGPDAGRLYAVWARFSSENRSSIVERHSDDGGVNFSARRTLDTAIVGDPQVIARPDGTAVALWVRHRRTQPDRLDIRSAAGAAGAFDAPRTLTTVTNSGFGTGYDTIPSLASDDAGNVLACWQETVDRGGSRATIGARCARSSDGRNWSAPASVDAVDRGSQQGLVVAAGGRAGRFYLLFYKGRAGGPFAVTLLKSDDAGASFSPAGTLDTVRIQPDAFWLGDYVGLDATPTGAAAAYTVPRGRGLRSIRVRTVTIP